MAYVVTPLSVSGDVSSDAITSTTTTQVECAGASFITDGGVPGDALSIFGSASNDGIYIVVEVVSETVLEVYPPLTAGGASGTASVRLQQHTLTIVDETSVSCSSIASAMASLDPRLFRKIAGTFTRGSSIDRSHDVYSSLFRFIRFDATSAIHTDFVMIEETLVYGYDRRTVTGAASLSNLQTGNIRNEVGTLGSLLIQLGSLGGSSPLSASNGCALIGYVPQTSDGGANAWLHCYGSLIASGDAFNATTANCAAAGQSRLFNSVLHSQLQIVGDGGGGISIVNSSIGNDSDVPLALLGSPFAPEIENLTIAESGSIGILAVFDDVILRSLQLSDALPSPLFGALTSSFTIDDLAEDVAMDSLFVPSSGSTFAKRYTFNPRFVNINELGLSVPIAGLEVSIEKVTDVHYVRVLTGAVGTWTIVINGVSINAAGAAGANGTRNALVSAINAAAVPVSAANAANGVQIGAASGTFHISADVPDTQFSVVLQAPPGAGNWVLDPAPAGKAATAPDDYREGPVSGSPFTTDENGRINTAGIVALRGIQSETTHVNRSVSVQLKIVIEGDGYQTQTIFFAPSAPFVGDYAIPKAKMGKLR